MEADHTKLKVNFVGCEISLWLRNYKRTAAKSAFGYEITRGWLRNGVLHAAKFRSHLARLRNSLEASRYLRLTFFRFFALDI